jgi:hypothetical protein
MNRALICGVLLAATSCAAEAGVSPVSPSSQAGALSAQLTVDDVQTNFGPVASVEGSDPGPYDNKVSLAHEKTDVSLVPSLITPTLSLDAHDLHAEVKSGGVGIDTLGAAAQANLGATTVSLNLKPLPPTLPPVPAPLLTVTLKGAHAHSEFSEVVPMPATAKGSAGFDSLTISGSLIGGATLHFSGDVKPNTVVYSTPQLTITLNRQLRVGLISCTPTCSFTLASFATQAIDISINHAKWYGHKISGDIAIGQTQVH